MIDQLTSSLQSYQQKGGLLAAPDRNKLTELRTQLAGILGTTTHTNYEDEKISIEMRSSMERHNSSASNIRDGFSEKGSSEDSEDRGEQVHRLIVSQISNIYKNLKVVRVHGANVSSRKSSTAT